MTERTPNPSARLRRDEAGNAGARRRRRSGLTLIEMLVVVTILALFAGYVGLKYWRHADQARVTAARNQINTLRDALITFKLAHGNFPTSEQGLVALRSELSGDVPPDPWGHPYLYKYPGEHGDEPEIISYGADGQPGGEGINADVVSWKSQ
jgi:general secretion pathway protein G